MRCLLLLVLSCLAGTGTLAAQARPRTPWDDTARALLRELVEINTTYSTGSTARAAHAMARRMREAGWPEADVVVVENAPEKGNLIVRYRGRNADRKPILLLSHIDVVEANAEDWTLPPFEFVERDGIFYGRGTADDKDESAIHLTVLLRLKAEGWVPDRDIIVALTADEEGGPENGVEWLLANRRDLIDAAFALNEGGGGLLVDGRRVSHNVQASEKVVLNLQLEVTNPGGHSSVPRPDNAIAALAEAIVRISRHQFPVRLNEVTQAYFARAADVLGPALGPAARRLAANPSDAAAAAVLSQDPRINAQLRTTCVATMVDAGHARNALPQRARATVNCRVLPTETLEETTRALERVIGNPDVRLTQLPGSGGGPPSPLTPEVLDAVTTVTTELWPGVPVIPTMSTGATDGLYLRREGIPVYGVSGLFYPDTGAHGMNERIPAEAFYQGLEFMYRLVKRLTGPGVS